jgi:hypothetical protein
MTNEVGPGSQGKGGKKEKMGNKEKASAFKIDHVHFGRFHVVYWQVVMLLRRRALGE